MKSSLRKGWLVGFACLLPYVPQGLSTPSQMNGVDPTPAPSTTQAPTPRPDPASQAPGNQTLAADNSEQAPVLLEPFEGNLKDGLETMRSLAKEGSLAQAEQFAERLLAESGAELAQTWLENKLMFLGPRAVRWAHGILYAAGWSGRTAEERAVVRYDLGILQVEAGSLEAAQSSFQAATYLAAGVSRERSTYNLGWLELTAAEALFDQIPEVHGRTASAMSPGFVASKTKGDEEEPDYLKESRSKYAMALGHFVERLKLDWRDEDTRANVEWIQKRMDELREIEEKRKSDEGQGMAQDDPAANQGDQEENKDDAGDKGAESEEKPQDSEQQSEDSAPRDEEQGQEGQPKDSEDEGEDGKQRDQASQEEQEAKETPEEHTLTEEEMKRLLKRMEEYSKEGERLRGMMKPRPQGRVKKDW